MMRKNVFVMLSTLGISLSASAIYAAAPAKTTDNNTITVSIPDFKPGFEYTLGALWLKAGASNLNYVIYNKGLPLQSPTWTEEEIHPGFSPAFDLGVRYYLPNAKGSDVNLDWTHLSSTATSSVAADSTTYFLGPDYEIGPVGIPIRNADGKATFKYDVINLDVGQYLQFGHAVDLRFFGGLSTAFLRENVNANYAGNTVGLYAGPFNVNQDVISNFTGFGPRAGIHADINTCSGFGFLGEAAVSALFGSIYSKTSYVSSAQQLLVVYDQTTNYQNII
jgi:hypothetical protein